MRGVLSLALAATTRARSIDLGVGSWLADFLLSSLRRLILYLSERARCVLTLRALRDLRELC